MTCVLCIAAHPDDEVLGVGGTLARHARLGDEVRILIMAEGSTARGDAAARDVERRRAGAIEAARRLGLHEPELLGLPDQRLDAIDRLVLVQQIEAVIARLQPSVVYTHHAHDLNLDHRIVHESTITACRALAGHPVMALYAFETPSSTEWAPPAALRPFAPQRFVDIAGTLGLKLAALEAYSGEMRPFPHPRSVEAIEALARWRGATAGFRAAEAFEVIRERIA